jgi:FkbM family methyltransferase
MFRELRKRIVEYLDQMRYPRTVEVQHASTGNSLYFSIGSGVERHRVIDFGSERGVLKEFLKFIEPDDIVYDIGASVGVYTVHASALLMEGRVYSFEPDPGNFARLQKNVTLNSPKNVELISWALGEKNGTSKLYTDGAEGFAPTLKHQGFRERAPRQQIWTAVRKLDSCIVEEKFQKPDIIKVDIEGAEGDFLRGATNTLSGEYGKPPRVIAIEFHPDFNTKFGDNTTQLVQKLSDWGYQSNRTLEAGEQKVKIFLRQN